MKTVKRNWILLMKQLFGLQSITRRSGKLA